MIKANGTDAKDIAIHFINATSGRATPSIMARTINQAKTLLTSGYTKEEVKETIDYIISNKNIDMYSLGYVSTCINNILKEIIKTKQKNISNLEKEKLDELNKAKQDEVEVDGNSAERNRAKTSRFGVQPRFGKEFTFDLFKEH